MAGDWIKMRHDLQDDPAVIAMAATLELDEYAVIGRLHKWWSWLDRQSETGNAVSVTEKWIDRYVGVSGFAQALLSTGWLAGRDGQYDVPNFDRHNGKSAKKRALTAQRVKRLRNADGNADRNAASVTREEKRRDIPPKSPSGGLSGDKSPSKPARQPPPLNAPQHAFVAYAKSIGIEARVGELDDDFRQRVIRTVAESQRVAA